MVSRGSSPLPGCTLLDCWYAGGFTGRCCREGQAREAEDVSCQERRRRKNGKGTGRGQICRMFSPYTIQTKRCFRRGESDEVRSLDVYSVLICIPRLLWRRSNRLHQMTRREKRNLAAVLYCEQQAQAVMSELITWVGLNILTHFCKPGVAFWIP